MTGAGGGLAVGPAVVVGSGLAAAVSVGAGGTSTVIVGGAVLALVTVGAAVGFSASEVAVLAGVSGAGAGLRSTSMSAMMPMPVATPTTIRNTRRNHGEPAFLPGTEPRDGRSSSSAT